MHEAVLISRAAIPAIPTLFHVLATETRTRLRWRGIVFFGIVNASIAPSFLIVL